MEDNQMSVDVTVEDRIATVVLNRPEAMNSIDPDMRKDWNSAIQRIRTDPDIWVAIITGAGDRAFCTGSDLKKTMPRQESFAQQQFGDTPPESLTAEMHHIDKPFIAAINGYAVGGGLEIALACDIRICAQTAHFGLSEVKVGSIPGTGGTQRLPRAIGLSDAMLMLLTGDRVDAREAHDMRLVSKVVAQEELMSTARTIARTITQNAPLAVRAVKRLVREGLDVPLPHALDLERCAFGLLYASEDRIEGRRAFTEKRPPNYRGR